MAGLVHAHGEKLNRNLKLRFEELEREDKLFFRPVPNLFTLDDNRQLGIHYLDYTFGPHNVPYGDYENSMLRKAIKG